MSEPTIRISRLIFMPLLAALAGCAVTPYYRPEPGVVPNMTRQDALNTLVATRFFNSAYGNFDDCPVTVATTELVFNCRSHGVTRCPYAKLGDPVVKTALGVYEMDLSPECPIHIGFAQMPENATAWANSLYALKHADEFPATLPTAAASPAVPRASRVSGGGGLSGMLGRPAGASNGGVSAAEAAEAAAGPVESSAALPSASRASRPGEEPRAKAAQASDVDEPAYAPSVARPDDFALVIGIAKYRDIPEAEFADRDAAAFKRHLLAMGYPEENVVTLLGDRATNSSLTEKLERWLPKNVGKNSTLFVYFSGHGAPDPDSKQAYLVPWDGQPADLADTAFPLARFYDDLRKLPAKRVVVALDACFSGAGGRSVLVKGARPLVTKVNAAVPDDGKLVVFAASQVDQISLTLEEKGHGAFTYYFLKGLGGEAASSADGGHVTVDSMQAYLSKRVSAAAHRQEREQDPQLLPAGTGNGAIRIR